MIHSALTHLRHTRKVKTNIMETKNSKNRRMNTGVRSHSCFYCDKGFGRKSELEIHIRIHTGVKPFNCSTCDYSCTQSSSLKRHERTVHTGTKPFSCSKCDYKFSQLSSLKRHERIHTGENHLAVHIVTTNAHSLLL